MTLPPLVHYHPLHWQDLQNFVFLLIHNQSKFHLLTFSSELSLGSYNILVYVWAPYTFLLYKRLCVTDTFAKQSGLHLTVTCTSLEDSPSLW